MNLPIKHVHKEKTSDHAALLLMLLPAIVFFLIITILFLNYDRTAIKLSENNEASTVLGEKSGSNKK
jgi:hypothetical protein